MGAGAAPDDVGVFIVNIKGLVLDPVTATPGSLVRIEAKKETEYESQLWRLREDGIIEHVNTGLILTIPGGTASPVGTKITITQEDPATSQTWRFDGEIGALLCEGRREIALDVEGVGMSGASAIVWYRQKPAQATSQRWSFRPPTAENASRSPTSPFPFVPLTADTQPLPSSPLSPPAQLTDFSLISSVTADDSLLPPPPLPADAGSLPPPPPPVADPAALPPPLDAASLPPPPTVCPAPSSDASLPLPPPPPVETDQPTPLSPSSPSPAPVHSSPPPPANVTEIDKTMQSLKISSSSSSSSSSSDNQNSLSSPLPSAPSAPFSPPAGQPSYLPQTPYPAASYPPSQYPPPLTTSQYQPPSYYPPPPGYAPPYGTTSTYAPSPYVSYATPSPYSPSPSYPSSSSYPSVTYSTVHSSGYAPAYPLTTSTYATPLATSSYSPSLTTSSYSPSLTTSSYSPSLNYSALGSFSHVPGPSFPQPPLSASHSPSSPSLPSSASTAPPTGLFFIGSKLGDSVLDVDRTNGMHVITWPRKPANFNNQLWKIDPEGFIYSLDSGLVLEVAGDKDARAGSRVRVWYKKPVDHETAANQRWRYDPQSMAFVNFNGLCLDIDSSSTAPGTALLAWTPLGNRPNQQFYFIPYTN